MNRNDSDDYDSPWKEALEIYFEAFMAFFFPEAHAEIDWSRGHDFLDKELQKVTRRAEVGRRAVDKLVRVWLQGGEETWVLVHVEVQAQSDPSFAERMYVYNYRLFDRYRRKVASLAVLADDQPGWKPSSCGYTLWGCEVSLRFPVVKLFDYWERWAELEESPNPFAMVVMAHLEAQRTQSNIEERLRAKWRLIRGLFRRGYKRDDVGHLLRFIDWLVALPEELEQALQLELDALKEETMPYVTSWERLGHKRGLEEGREEGREQGLEQGRRDGLLEAVRLGLELRFGEQGLTLMPELQASDEAVLSQLCEALRRGATLEELRKIWQG